MFGKRVYIQIINVTALFELAIRKNKPSVLQQSINLCKIKFSLRLWSFIFFTSILFFSWQSSGYSQSPYKLDLAKESIFFGASLGMGVLTFPLNDDIEPLMIDEINNLNRNDVNKFDSGALYNYSETEGNISNILLYTSILSPALLAFSDDTRNDFSPVITMYVETLLLSAAIPFVTKGITQRVRPFAYNDNAPLSIKQTKDAKRSFFSGHTTVSFAMAVFLSTVYSDYYPDSDWKPVVWAGSLALATTVGVLRYSSGSHFPTDIITGALVGSAIGYFIPFMHRTGVHKLNVSFGVSRSGSLINFNYQF
jgi:membrane-associated phospholipid phosphatase